MNNLHLLPPDDIIARIKESHAPGKVDFLGFPFHVLPGVFPSHFFGSSEFLVTTLRPFLHEKRVLDMGCGFGVTGICAAHWGAKSVVQVDINPRAVENTILNRVAHNLSPEQVQVYLSDCFTNVPEQLFDVIIFNPAFETNPHRGPSTWLDYAFFDPEFKTMSTFLRQATAFINDNSKVFLAFSNKGDTVKLEYLFDQYGYRSALWRVINQNRKYDNRIYLLTAM